MNPTATLQNVRDMLLDEQIPSFKTRYPAWDNFTGRPAILGDLQGGAYSQAVQRVLTRANRQFCVEGTNMTSALSLFHSGGGIELTTAGANNDQAILRPIQTSGDTQDLSALQVTQWLTTKSVRLTWVFELSAITAVRFMAGLVGALATGATALQKGTANEQAVIHFDTGDSVSASRFRVVSSNNGTDTEAIANKDLNGTGQMAAVAADTRYQLDVLIDAGRVPTFYINGIPVGRTVALKDNTALFPVIGIHALEGAAKALRVRWFGISRLW